MDVIKVILTSLLSVVSLFLMAKLMGHKQLAQLDFFDYINGITIGSIAAELATELEAPYKPLIALVIYGIVAVILAIVTHKFPRMRKFINGTPTIIMNNGHLYRDNMKKAKLDLSEFMMLCREQGYFNLNDIYTATFEANGNLTILPVSKSRPATPNDFNIAPTQEKLCTEVIMDGRIMGENLRRMGVDESWLHKNLKEQGYKHERDIYLAVCDSEKQLTVFPNEKPK